MRVEYEYATVAANPTTAIRRFAKKYPEVYEVWQGQLEWMAESEKEFESDNVYGDGTKKDWTYAIHFQSEPAYECNKNEYYICVIERN